MFRRIQNILLELLGRKKKMINKEERLIFHEGLRLQPYLCPAKKWTIGVGRCYETNPFTGEELRAIGDYKHGITKNAAMFLLRNDIERCENELKKSFNWYEKMDEERQYAILDMDFQLGLGGLKKFKKMIYYLQRLDYEKAAIECLDSAYAKQTPKRAKRIAHLISTGEWIA